jgi:hypothetical protein
LRHSIAAHTDTLIQMVDRRVSQLWGRASKKAKADQGALPALTVLVAGIRQAIGEKDKSKDAQFGAIVDLVRSYDDGDLKPMSIAARQRALRRDESRYAGVRLVHEPGPEAARARRRHVCPHSRPTGYIQ